MIKNLSINEKKLRDLYLRKLSLGEVQGPPTGYSSIDKPWLKYYGEDGIVMDIPTGISMYDLIYERNKDNLDKNAISYYGTKITYIKFFREVDKLAIKYRNLGVKEGDIVSICMPSTPEAVYSIYALNKIGAVCDMIDPRSNAKQLDYYLKENKSKVILLCENYYNYLKQSLNNMDKVIVAPISITGSFKFRSIVNISTKLSNLNTKYEDNVILYDDFLKINGEKNVQERDENRSIYSKLDDVALIIHSSGTTSVPKGIVLTNKNVNAIAIQYQFTPLKLEKGFRFLSVIPAFASFGVVASINLPFYLSMENHLVSLVTTKDFYKRLVKDKINFTLTIPANFKYVAKQMKKCDLSNLYGPGAGGYSVTSAEEEEINESLKKNGCPSNMLMGWGMSEISSTACLEFPECSKELSSGVPLIKNTIAIFKPNTEEELSYGNEGEICVTGPTVMKGYLNNSEKTNKVIRLHKDGNYWLHSGDLGYMDNEGRVFPVDRLERMIIKGSDGFKIFPKQIEEVVNKSSYVDSCVVVGYKDKLLGTVPKVYIVPKSKEVSKDIIFQDVLKKCREFLSVRAIPDDYELLDSMPYTPMGKIDYRSLENNFNENEKKLVKKK